MNIDYGDEPLVQAGKLRPGRRMRLNHAVLQPLIKADLISGFEDIAGRWAEGASATDLAFLLALLNTDRKPLDVLEQLLICETRRKHPERKETAVSSGAGENEPAGGTWNSFLHRARGGDVAGIQSLVRLEVGHESKGHREPANLGGRTGSRSGEAGAAAGA